MLTKEDMEQIVAEAKAQLLAGLVESVKRDIQYAVQRQLADEVGAIVREYITANVAPAVHEALVGQESILIGSTVAACKDASKLLTAAIAEKVTKSLTESYQRKKVLEAIFGGY